MTEYVLITMCLALVLAMGSVFVLVLGRTVQERVDAADRRREAAVVRRHEAFQRAGGTQPDEESAGFPRAGGLRRPE